MEFGENMKKITLKEMLETEVYDILTNYSFGGHIYFIKMEKESITKLLN